MWQIFRDTMHCRACGTSCHAHLQPAQCATRAAALPPLTARTFAPQPQQAPRLRGGSFVARSHPDDTSAAGGHGCAFELCHHLRAAGDCRLSCQCERTAKPKSGAIHHFYIQSFRMSCPGDDMASEFAAYVLESGAMSPAQRRKPSHLMPPTEVKVCIDASASSGRYCVHKSDCACTVKQSLCNMTVVDPGKVITHDDPGGCGATRRAAAQRLAGGRRRRAGRLCIQQTARRGAAVTWPGADCLPRAPV